MTSKQIAEESERTHSQMPLREVYSDRAKDVVLSVDGKRVVSMPNAREKDSTKTVYEFDIADDSLNASDRQRPEDADARRRRQTMSSPAMFGNDIEIRARRAEAEAEQRERPALSADMRDEGTVDTRTSGELNFLRERQGLRAHRVIEQAWLIFQFMKNNKARAVQDDDDLTPNQLEALLKSLQCGEFGSISSIMDQSKIFRLQNDADASLTASSLLNYTMLIK